MNAKKIMGAVLVALLAAALFVGAGAAADPASGTVFTNQKLGVEYNVIWTGTAGAMQPSADPVLTNTYFFPTASKNKRRRRTKPLYMP